MRERDYITSIVVHMFINLDIFDMWVQQSKQWRLDFSISKIQHTCIKKTSSPSQATRPTDLHISVALSQTPAYNSEITNMGLVHCVASVYSPAIRPVPIYTAW